VQHGVPLQTLVDTFSHSGFDPSGMTKNHDVRFASHHEEQRRHRDAESGRRVAVPAARP
jgi:hypothetical protein